MLASILLGLEISRSIEVSTETRNWLLTFFHFFFLDTSNAFRGPPYFFLTHTNHENYDKKGLNWILNLESFI